MSTNRRKPQHVTRLRNCQLARPLTACLATLVVALAGSPATSAERPNIVLLLADDLGYGDLGCYGCPDIRTPHLDRLAAQGVRLTSFYSNGPECSPTRTALLTGRYQQRVGGLECAIGLGNVGRYDDAIRLAEAHDLGLPVERSVLARGLKEAGYATACIGKWHLGYEPKFLPQRHGFDTFFGPLGGGVDYFHHYEPGGEHMLFQNDKPVRRDGYLTDLIGEEAVRFLQQTKQPYFLYVPFTAPHTPLQGPHDKPAEPTALEDFNRGTRETYVKMVERLDEVIGTILTAVDKSGTADNTLVIFASDNGGTRIGRNRPFSGQKSSTLEGGIRVPCILRWPARLAAASESSQVAITMDLTRSILAAAEASTPNDLPLDGLDIVEHLREGKPDEPRTLFWRQRRGQSTWRAVRDGDLKLVSRQQGEQREDQLFDLVRDSAETNDLRAARPDDFQRLQGLLTRWEEEVQPNR